MPSPRRRSSRALQPALEILADLLLAQVHAEAVLGVILEQRVRPCGALTLFVHSVGGGGSRAAPDGGASGRVGNEHVVAVELGNESRVAGLGAARAAAGELQVGLGKLAELHVAGVGHLTAITSA